MLPYNSILGTLDRQSFRISATVQPPPQITRDLGKMERRNPMMMIVILFKFPY